MVSPTILPAPPQLPLAVLLLGPTGSGKSALALALAERFQGEIISCDSVAVYRGMDIGSAKPTPDQRTRLPHHLIDVVTPPQHFSAGDYSRLARAALREVASRQHLPLVTGGTGLYLRALTLGLFAGPERHPQLRERLTQSHQKHTSGWLHRILHRLDPEAAQRIHANDIPKLIRAIEVSITCAQPISRTHAAGRDPLTGFRLLRIGLNPPRPALYQRINDRAAAMFAHGLVDETAALLSQYGHVPALDALGYRQAVDVLLGHASLPDAIAAAQQGHRNYAKRQLTWFRREPDVRWIEDFGDLSSTMAQAALLVQQAL